MAMNPEDARPLPVLFAILRERRKKAVKRHARVSEIDAKLRTITEAFLLIEQLRASNERAS